MNTVILQYETDKGYEWLEEEVIFKDEDYKYVIDQYILKTRKEAVSLLAKWESDGEEVTFYMDILPIHCKPDVHNKMELYIDSLEERCVNNII